MEKSNVKLSEGKELEIYKSSLTRAIRETRDKVTCTKGVDYLTSLIEYQCLKNLDSVIRAKKFIDGRD